jgi:hypothetical protein
MQVRYTTYPYYTGHKYKVQKSYWWLPYWIDVSILFDTEDDARLFAYRLKHPIVEVVK